MEVILNQRPARQRALLRVLRIAFLFGLGALAVAFAWHGNYLFAILLGVLVALGLLEKPADDRLTLRDNALHWKGHELELSEVRAVYQGRNKTVTLATKEGVFQPPVNHMKPQEFLAFLRSMKSHADRNQPESSPPVGIDYRWHPAWDWGILSFLVGGSGAMLWFATVWVWGLAVAVSACLLLAAAAFATGTGPMRLGSDGLHYKTALGKDRFIPYQDILARKTTGVGHRLGQPMPVKPTPVRAVGLHLVTKNGPVKLRPRLSLMLRYPDGVPMAAFSYQLGKFIQAHTAEALGSK